MCDKPTNYEEAVKNYAELDANYKKHKKAMETAEEKLKEAKKLIEAGNPNWKPEEGHEVDAGDYIIKAGKKRETKYIPDQHKVAIALNTIKMGLAVELATYDLKDIADYFTPNDLKKLYDTRYGARTFSVKKK